MKQRFGGRRMQKISVNGGFSCPNRDGRLGTGGCTFCNNQTFVPDYCVSDKSISQQVEEGIDFFKHKYTQQGYLVYFQSFTNTYAPFERLKTLYEEALSYEGVEGIVIGTRPDCVSDELLDYLEQKSKQCFVMIEYGIESVYDSTLQLINRGHDFQTAVDTIERTTGRGIDVGVHVILGLPCETKEMILHTAEEISKLPVTVVKLHQLQLIRGTKMEQQYLLHPEWFHFFDVEEYVDLVVDFLERLNPEIYVERFVSSSPKEFLLLPQWGLKNFEFTAKVEKRLKERNTYQGILFAGL